MTSTNTGILNRIDKMLNDDGKNESAFYEEFLSLSKAFKKAKSDHSLKKRNKAKKH